MALYDLNTLLSKNSYPGRGIVVGKSSDGKKALIAYFIMGRSENSRNRIFQRFDGGMRTRAFDESKLTDPSLIIYNPYLTANGGKTDIITNGDQTNTIYDFITADPNDSFAFERALETREFEPDCPNFTPRISAILNYTDGDFTYKMSILKSANGNDAVCERFTYSYSPLDGIGHFIHTYKCDGNPIPSFYGEPEEVALPDCAEELAELVWAHLNFDNKVSLFVREVDLETGASNEVIFNKNK